MADQADGGRFLAGDFAETPEIAARRAAHAGAFSGGVALCGHPGLPPEPGRFHLYVSYVCPFAHRAILVRALKRLDGAVGLPVLHPRWSTPDGRVVVATATSTPDFGGCGFMVEDERGSLVDVSFRPSAGPAPGRTGP